MAGERVKRFFGGIGVWLCNRCYPRPATKVEAASSQQYAALMIDVLRGQVSYYGRDAKQPIMVCRREEIEELNRLFLQSWRKP